MRDPLTWSFPLPWRPLGVALRVHILFPVVTVGLVIWVATAKQFPAGLWIQMALVLLMLFVSVLLHELGHVVAARSNGGDASEILLWPLGGLASVELPAVPRAHFRTALAGPLVNLGLALIAGGSLALVGLVPPPNPLASPLTPTVYSWRDGIRYNSRFVNLDEPHLYYYEADGAKHQVRITFDFKKDGTVEVRDSEPLVERATVAGRTEFVLKETPKGAPVRQAQLERWQVLLAQFFLVNWFLFALNLLPAFPLDGGRMLQ